MTLPNAVHAFSIQANVAGRDTRIHPAAVETDRGLLLVDVGFEDTAEAVMAAIEEAGFNLADVGYILLTHQDMDHAGGIAQFREATDATVLAHEKDSPIVDGRSAPRAVPDAGRYPPAPVDVELREGVTIRTRAGPARLIETPGHTPGHCSLYLPDERLLLAGDAVIVVDEELHPPRRRFTMDVERAAESIGRLAEYDIERVLCFHGGFIEQGADRLRRLATAE